MHRNQWHRRSRHLFYLSAGLTEFSSTCLNMFVVQLRLSQFLKNNCFIYWHSGRKDDHRNGRWANSLPELYCERAYYSHWLLALYTHTYNHHKEWKNYALLKFCFVTCTARCYADSWRIFRKAIYRIRLFSMPDGAKAAMHWFVYSNQIKFIWQYK